MPYGSIKVDNIIYTNGGVDTTVTVSGLTTTSSGNITVTGTVSGKTANFISGNFSTNVSGATVIGTTGTFTSLTGTTTTGTTANFISGVFTTQVSGATITGTSVQGITVSSTTGTFVSLTGATTTGTTANFISGNFSTSVSGATVIASTGTFTSLTGTTTQGTTASFATGNFTSLTGTTTTGTTANYTTGNFTSLTGTTTTGTTANYTTGNFISLTGTTATGTTANFVSGVFTTLISGATITGTAVQGITVSSTTGTFTSLTGTTTTGTTANFESGVFTTRVSGVTVISTTGTFTSLTGTTTQGTTANFTTGTFTSLTGTTTQGTTVRFADADSSNWVAFQAPATVVTNVTWTLPATDGTSAQVLSTNGSGTLSWATAAGGNRRPPLTRGPLFTKTAATTLSVIAGAVLNGQYYSSATAVTMPSHSNNTDYAIWQHPTTGALVGDASFVTAPAGATGGSIVAGYHYIPSGRPTAFNNGSPTTSAEILQYSIWDLTWRPECPDPRGMTCINDRFWCDLYLCGSTSYATTAFTAVPSSKIGLTIADNSSPALIPSFYGGDGSTAYTLTGGNDLGSWYNFAEVAHSFGKRFMWSWEFQAAAFGAPEAGSRGTDPGTVIWERASKWGLAQATGTLSVWGAERVGICTGGANNTNTGGRGTEVADAPRAVNLGGSWNSGSYPGSRNAQWCNVPSSGSISLGARFAAGHLTLG